MQYTNKYNLPEEVFKALTKDRYAGNTAEIPYDYSVTTLVNPIQQTVLRRKHKDTLVETQDAVDMLWSMFGSIAHNLLEEHGSDDSITERRLYLKVMGKMLSGQLDHYKDEIITDYKTTSVFKIKNGEYDDWEKQLNCYAYLCRINDLPVRSIRIVAILRDWRAQEAIRGDGYPKAPIVIIPITLWEPSEQFNYINARLNLLVLNETLPDNQLLSCNQEEMWASETIFAIMKPEAKKASALFNTLEEAQEYIAKLAKPKGEYIQTRLGERRRCANYCDVSSVCHQYQTYLKEKGVIEE